MVCYLHNLDCPTHLNKSQDKSLKLKYIGYCILNNKLFLKDPLGVLLNCVVENEIERIFNYLHKGYCGGHYSWRIKTHKILRSRFYWPTLFIDVNRKVRSCLESQLFARKQKISPLPLKSIKAQAPFQQWGLAFIG